MVMMGRRPSNSPAKAAAAEMRPLFLMNLSVNTLRATSMRAKASSRYSTTVRISAPPASFLAASHTNQPYVME